MSYPDLARRDFLRLRLMPAPRPLRSGATTCSDLSLRRRRSRTTGPDIESNAVLLGLMFAYGASIQDEDARVVINSRTTVEAVKVATPLFRSAMTDEVLSWDITSNNRYFVSGRGSLIVNSIAKTAEARIQPIYDKWREQGKI